MGVKTNFYDTLLILLKILKIKQINVRDAQEILWILAQWWSAKKLLVPHGQ